MKGENRKTNAKMGKKPVKWNGKREEWIELFPFIFYNAQHSRKMGQWYEYWSMWLPSRHQFHFSSIFTQFSLRIWFLNRFYSFFLSLSFSMESMHLQSALCLCIVAHSHRQSTSIKYMVIYRWHPAMVEQHWIQNLCVSAGESLNPLMTRDYTKDNPSI